MSWCSFSQYITLRVPKTMSFHSSTVKFSGYRAKKTAVIHLEAKMSSLYELSYYTVFRSKIIKLDLPPKRCIFDRMLVKPSCVWEVEIGLCCNFQIGTPSCYTDNFPCLCHSFTSIPFKKMAKMVHPAENRLFSYLFHLNRFSLIFQASLILHSWKSWKFANARSSPFNKWLLIAKLEMNQYLLKIWFLQIKN